MNIFTRLVLLPASFFLLLDACTLQDHRPAVQNPECQIQTLTVTSKSSVGMFVNKDEIFEIDGKQVPIGKLRSYKYTFDDQNRLIESHLITYTGSTADSRITYEYGPTQVTRKIYQFGSSVPDLLESLPLNAAGLWGKDGLTYNADGFLVEDKTETVITTYTILDGNIVLKELKDAVTNKLNERWTYEYDLTKPNLPNIEPYKGKTSKNLLVKRTIVFYNNSGSEPVPSATYIANFNYIFDEANHLIRQYSKDPDTGGYGTDDYTYTCR